MEERNKKARRQVDVDEDWTHPELEIVIDNLMIPMSSIYARGLREEEEEETTGEEA